MTTIAGQALSRNLPLVTANIREFRCVDSVLTDDWTLSGCLRLSGARGERVRAGGQ